MKRNKSWKLYLYYNGQCIARKRINENYTPMDKIYVIKVIGKKHLFGSNFAQVIVKPFKYKYTDEEKKQAHIEVTLFEGVDYSG